MMRHSCRCKMRRLYIFQANCIRCCLNLKIFPCQGIFHYSFRVPQVRNRRQIVVPGHIQKSGCGHCEGSYQSGNNIWWKTLFAEHNYRFQPHDQSATWICGTSSLISFSAVISYLFSLWCLQNRQKFHLLFYSQHHCRKQ